jgi:hypothetical protein
LLEKIDFEADNIFLEPLLFTYFNSKKDNLFSKEMLTEIMQGYFVENEPILLKESFNNYEIAFVPNLGYFDKQGNKQFFGKVERGEAMPVIRKSAINDYQIAKLNGAFSGTGNSAS